MKLERRDGSAIDVGFGKQIGDLAEGALVCLVSFKILDAVTRMVNGELRGEQPLLLEIFDQGERERF